MSIVHLFVSTGRFSSFEALREYIDPTYTDDGDLIPSSFIEEVELDDYEPAASRRFASRSGSPFATSSQAFRTPSNG